MKAQKRNETETPAIAPDLFRLAELFHMRRRTIFMHDGAQTFYECQLCLGTSRGDAGGEIHHIDDCPVLRLRG